MSTHITDAVRCTLCGLISTLVLVVQRTLRQSSRRLTQPVSGNNLFADTFIRALQGVRLPPV